MRRLISIKFIRWQTLYPLIFLLNFLTVKTSDRLESIPEFAVNETEGHFIERLFQHYHHISMPEPKPVNVQINLKINSVGAFSAKSWDYNIDIFLRQRWQDNRLKFKNYNKTIYINYMKSRLWTPDLFVHEAVTTESQNFNDPKYLIWLDKDGNIFLIQKFNMQVTCILNLYRFPMDEQICSIKISSFGFPFDAVQIQWMYGPNSMKNVEVNYQELSGDEFTLHLLRSLNCSLKHELTGHFSCLKVEFHFLRKFGYFLINVYLPSSLVVAISWLSFLVDFTSSPARASMGFLSVLTIITQTKSSGYGTPRVSYTKAIDIWLFACLAFVVVSLVEFAFVSSMCNDVKNPLSKITRRLINQRFRKSRDKTISLDAGIDELVQLSGNNFKDQNKKRRFSGLMTLLSGKKLPKETGYKVDGMFFVAYPVAFAIFNIYYWIHYSMLAEEEH